MKATLRTSRMAARLHRTLGNLFSVLTLMWFASGVVMVFWPYPYASAAERLALVQPLLADDLPSTVAQTLWGPVRDGQTIRMYRGPDGSVLIRPDGYFDMHGTLVAESSAAVCQQYLQKAAPELQTSFKGVVSSVGQWTVAEHIRSRLPLYLYEGSTGDRHYLDPVGCVLVQHSTAAERFWAYFGAIPHWLYVAPLRQHREIWRWLIIALSTVGLLVCCTGLYRGFTILRRKSGSRVPTSPILRPTLRWHHLTGLAFGVLTFTWFLSGAMSLSPFDLSPKHPTFSEARKRFAVGTGLQSLQTSPRQAYHACLTTLPDVSLLELIPVAGKPYYLCHSKHGTTRIVDGTRPGSTLAQEHFPTALLQSGAAQVVPGAAFVATYMDRPDAYYYPDHQASLFEAPYLRISFKNPDATTLYISPRSGTILRHLTTGQRANRWLYHGLHSLDFPILYRNLKLWHVLILALLLGGIVLSVSAVALTKRPFRRTPHRRSNQ